MHAERRAKISAGEPDPLKFGADVEIVTKPPAIVTPATAAAAAAAVAPVAIEMVPMGLQAAAGNMGGDGDEPLPHDLELGGSSDGDGSGDTAPGDAVRDRNSESRSTRQRGSTQSTRSTTSSGRTRSSGGAGVHLDFCFRLVSQQKFCPFILVFIQNIS